MLHVEGCSVMHQAQNVKTTGTIPGVMGAQPGLRGLADMRPLGGRQPVSRTTDASRRPCLDFHKNQLRSVKGHQIQLHMPVTPVAFQNAPALAAHKDRGGIFAASPQLRRRRDALRGRVAFATGPRSRSGRHTPENHSSSP